MYSIWWAAEPRESPYVLRPAHKIKKNIFEIDCGAAIYAEKLPLWVVYIPDSFFIFFFSWMKKKMNIVRMIESQRATWRAKSMIYTERLRKGKNLFSFFFVPFSVVDDGELMSVYTVVQ